MLLRTIRGADVLYERHFLKHRHRGINKQRQLTSTSSGFFNNEQFIEYSWLWPFQSPQWHTNCPATPTCCVVPIFSDQPHGAAVIKCTGTITEWMWQLSRKDNKTRAVCSHPHTYALIHANTPTPRIIAYPLQHLNLEVFGSQRWFDLYDSKLQQYINVFRPSFHKTSVLPDDLLLFPFGWP